MSPYVALYFAGLLVAVGVSLNCSRHLWPFLLIPFALGSIRFTGELMQAQHWGPVWAREHFGDVGIVADYLGLGIVLARRHIARKSPGASGYVWRDLMGHRIPVAMLTVSIVTYLFYAGVEAWTAWALDNPPAAGSGPAYSGRFDWADTACYTIGLVAMILNYVLIARRVRRNINPYY